MVAATLASLLVSFTLTPLIASRWLKSGSQHETKPTPARPVRADLRAVVPAAGARATGARCTGRCGTARSSSSGRSLVFCSNVLIVPQLGTEFVPEGDLRHHDASSASCRPARRSKRPTARRSAGRCCCSTTSGSRRSTRRTSRSGASGNPRQIQVTLDVGKPSTRQRTSNEIARAAIEAGEAIVPEMQARRNSERRPEQPSRSRSEVFGDDLEQLGQAAGAAQAALAAVPTLADVTNSLSSAEEVTIRPDLARLRDLGVTAQQIGTSVRVAYQGATVAKWAEASGKERDVRVTLPADGPQPAGRAGEPAADPARRPDADAPAGCDARSAAEADHDQRGSTGSGWRRSGPSRCGVPLGTATEDATAAMDGRRSCRPARAGSWPAPARSSRARSRR